jgi:hypothetical protein
MDLFLTPPPFAIHPWRLTFLLSSLSVIVFSGWSRPAHPFFRTLCWTSGLVLWAGKLRWYCLVHGMNYEELWTNFTGSFRELGQCWLCVNFTMKKLCYLSRNFVPPIPCMLVFYRKFSVQVFLQNGLTFLSIIWIVVLHWVRF